MTEALWRGRNAISNSHTKRPYSHPTITRAIITRRAAARSVPRRSPGRFRPEMC